jgi:hypothetical protein
VKRWLDGTRSHADTIRCIAAALAAKLGRPITPADIGFDNVDEAPVQADAVGGGTEYPTTPAQAVNLLADLTAADLAESPELASSTWSSDGTPAVITGYLFGDALRLAQPAELAGSGAWSPNASGRRSPAVTRTPIRPGSPTSTPSNWPARRPTASATWASRPRRPSSWRRRSTRC